MQRYEVTNVERDGAVERQHFSTGGDAFGLHELQITREFVRNWATFIVQVPETEQDLIKWYKGFRMINEEYDWMFSGPGGEPTIEEVLQEECYDYSESLILDRPDVEGPWFPEADEECIKMDDYWFHLKGCGELVDDRWTGEDEELLEQLSESQRDKDNKGVPEDILEKKGYKFEFTDWVIYGGVTIKELSSDD